jgi:hypothetical protein
MQVQLQENQLQTGFPMTALDEELEFWATESQAELEFWANYTIRGLGKFYTDFEIA